MPGWVLKLDWPKFGLGATPTTKPASTTTASAAFTRASASMATSTGWRTSGSSNGTYINGRRVTSCELSNGDTLNLGPRVSFRFSSATAHEERVLKQLYESSVRDPLTGAFNRHYFSSQLSSEVAYAARHETPLSVVLLDIDFFKKVNDTHGHLGGDAALVHLTNVFAQGLRTEDLLARYGGEEFVILLRGIQVDRAHGRRGPPAGLPGGPTGDARRSSLPHHGLLRLCQPDVLARPRCPRCCSRRRPSPLSRQGDGRNRVVSGD
jgi:hypothetical protein